MGTNAPSNVDDAVTDDDPFINESLPKRFERLFRQQNQVLVRMLTARLHDTEAAREVAQEAYEQVFKRDKAGTLTNLHAATLAYLRNYLFKTARNIATDRLRKRAVRIREAHQLTFQAELLEVPSAERLCIQQEEWKRLERAVQELPPRCRQAFILVEFECQPIKIVARQLGVKANTVSQLCKRAYEHLMKSLADMDQSQGRQS